MKAGPLLSRETEVQAFRLLEKKGGPSKAFLALWNKVQSAAMDFALEQPRVKQYLEGHRYAVVGGELRPVRGERRGKFPPRIGEVGIYDYDRNILLIAAVDLRKATLVDLEERPGIQPPLSKSELEEAKALVLASSTHRSLAKKPNLHVEAFAARVSFLHDHPARGHRVFTLAFWSGGRAPRKLRDVVVDLSDRRLLGDEDQDDAVMTRLLEDRREHAGEGN
jgi:hypothetical protein